MSKRGEIQPKKITLLLCNIRSAQNAGAIVRTADAIGVSEVIFGGYTPGPVDRFGRIRKEFTKASLGSEQSVSWRFSKDCAKELLLLKKKGFFLVAVEQSGNSVDYRKIKVLEKPTVVVLGNEVEGLPSKILQLADVIAEIPMYGKKESLNVSVATGIVLFQLLDR
jgi:tRNA G18 (ribose-2'-O)-methylase SpoU